MSTHAPLPEGTLYPADYTITTPAGDEATADTYAAARLAARTMVETDGNSNAEIYLRGERIAQGRMVDGRYTLYANTTTQALR